MSEQLFTLGYQGHSIETFLDLLQAYGIEHIIDVRQRPQGRKYVFNKKRLCEVLALEGISYTHLVELGTPKELRDAVRRDHDYPAFFAAMEPLIAAQTNALDAALVLIGQQRCALLCFEQDHHTCHRLTVADALVQRTQAPLEIVHIGG